ncbi:MAG: helix-turn-helix transcriptional regulator [Acidimicrobiales bacterium]
MTPHEAPDGIEIPAVIREVMHQARQATGSGTKFAARLKEFGIGPEDGYSESAISNWINGRAMPPADVLLAAAAIAGIPLGPDMGETRSPTEVEQEWRAVIALVQDQVDELRTEVIHLYGQMGIPRPQREKPPSQQRRAQAG